MQKKKRVDVILGLQWGDEGKGKIVDYLVQENDYDIVARFQGGCNAGHTVKIGDDTHILHIVPSGIPSEKIGLIGGGVVIEPITLMEEITQLENLEASYLVWDLLKVVYTANLTLPTHRWLDKAKEASKGDGKIGSTLKGIGPTYMDRTGRNALQFGMIHSDTFREQYAQLKMKHIALLDLYPAVEFAIEDEEKHWFAAIEQLKQLEVVSPQWLHNQIDENQKVLAEGAQGTLLDLSHGTYPYVTSSNTTIGGVLTGLGISHHDIGTVYGVVKAYTTRVGNGPFPTKLTCAVGKQLQDVGDEFGATTGRPRDCGWLDIPLLKRACIINGVDKLIVTKVDVLDSLEEIKICTSYRHDDKEYDVWPGAQIDLYEVEPIYESYSGWQEDTKSIRQPHNLPVKCSSYLNNAFRDLPPLYAATNGPKRKSIIRY